MDEQGARRLIAEHLAVSREMVEDDADFRVLGADSLDLITLTMRLEEAFDVEIADDRVNEALWRSCRRRNVQHHGVATIHLVIAQELALLGNDDGRNGSRVEPLRLIAWPPGAAVRPPRA